MSAEDQLIERVRRALAARSSARGSAAGLRLGIGDDAAIIAAVSPERELVLSCDAFIEGVHFLADRHPADSVGYKALARATSDLAAMGAKPRWFLMTLALPASRTGKWLDQFLGGMRRAAGRFGMELIGGDTTKADRVFVSITVGGETARERAITRAGAKPGDAIYVGGVLGAAQLGLLMVKSGMRAAAGRAGGALRAHLYPRIRVKLAEWLAGERVASAMIDISDGLSTDLGRLCAACGVGARIWAGRIPCVRIPITLRDRGPTALRRLDPLKLALDGGEDYELLFTVSRKNETRLRRAPGFAEMRRIGEIVRGRGMILFDNDDKPRKLRPGGWDPFRPGRR